MTHGYIKAFRNKKNSINNQHQAFIVVFLLHVKIHHSYGIISLFSHISDYVIMYSFDFKMDLHN